MNVYDTVSIIGLSIIEDAFYKSFLLLRLSLRGNVYFRGVYYMRCLLLKILGVVYFKRCLLMEVSIKGGVYYKGFIL